MPGDDPQLGETWYHAGSGAVVISMNSTQVRLMSRTGRRIVLPMKTLLSPLWSFVHDAPEKRVCGGGCTKAAYFRYSWGEEWRWVCEDHIPQGALCLLPCDSRFRSTNCTECPTCSQSNVVSQGLQDTRSGQPSVLFVCRDCSASWLSLMTRGEPEDGIRLAEDLPSLIDALQGSNLTIRAGFVALRALERTMGMRVDHFRGVTVVEDSRFGDNVVTVLRSPRSNLQSLQSLSQTRSENASGADLSGSDLSGAALGSQLREALENQPEAEVEEDAVVPTVRIGSYWRRRRIDDRLMLCRVTGNSDMITYEVIHNPHNLPVSSFGTTPPPMLPDQFEEHWARVDNYADAVRSTTLEPTKGSYWKSIEHQRVVRVIKVGSVIESRDQFERSYSQSLMTFLRLHKERPYPTTKTLWVREGKPYKVVQGVKRSNDITEILLEDSEDEFSETTLDDLLLNYEPMTFTQESSSTEVPMVSGMTWVHEGTRKKVTLYDIGAVHSTAHTEAAEFVRFIYEGEERVRFLPLDDFLDIFLFEEPEAPCMKGQEWQSTEGLIFNVTEVDPARRAVQLWNPQNKFSRTVSYDDMTDKYKKVERKSLLRRLLED